MPGYSC